MTRPTRALQATGEGRLELESIIAALSAHWVVAASSRQRVRRTRLDTFDRRLRAAGLTVEHEVLASGERLLLSHLDGSPTAAAPVRDLRWPALADVLPAGPIRDRIAPLTDIRALMVVSDERRRVQRLALQNKDGKTVARVELDEPAAAFVVSASASAAPTAPSQLIVQPLRGYDEQARRAERLLVGLGLRVVDADQERTPGSTGPSLPMDREEPARVLLATALSTFSASMRENVPGLLEDVDTEFLHDFRVAVRRTRATLKLGRPALPAAMQRTWEPGFKWLGDLTTPVRDLDVYELDLPRMSGWLVSADPADLQSFATHLRSRRMVERRKLVRSLRSVRFRRLVTEWDDELARLADTSVALDPPETSGTSDIPDVPAGAGDPGRGYLPAGRLADRSISRAYRRVARGGAGIGADSPAEDLHGLRKRCKELRYALEVFAPLIDHTARRRAVADLKGLQDVLGRFQDSEVQRLGLRDFAEEMMAEGTSAGAMLAMGELIGHLETEQDRARREFDVAFARFTRPSSLKLMHHLGGAA